MPGRAPGGGAERNQPDGRLLVNPGPGG